MDFLPVEFVSCREFYFEFVKDRIEDSFLMRLDDCNVLLAEHLHDFLHFLFVFYLNNDFHHTPPPIPQDSVHDRIECVPDFFIISIIRRISRVFLSGIPEGPTILHSDHT